MLGITPCRRPALPDYAEFGQGEVERRFSPYSENGGSMVAVAGDDFALIASDTRLCDIGYNILSRIQPKLFPLTHEAVLGATGCWADVLTLTKLMQTRIQMFKYTHNQTMRTSSAAQMLSTMLYSKRFFPYGVSNIVAGLDDDGKGVVYDYDPVGFMGKGTHNAAGTGVALMQPLLDNQVDKMNMLNVIKKPLALEEAERLVHDCFIAAAEREIHVGDAIAFNIITKDGIEEKKVALRRD